MDLKDLEYFKAVCEQKSITKAAHSLYMTPQGLSKLIKNMELELGAVLLNRSGLGITLTESGQYLYEQLPKFLHDYAHICKKSGVLNSGKLMKYSCSPPMESSVW